jgi:hypothetical protein
VPEGGTIGYRVCDLVFVKSILVAGRACDLSLWWGILLQGDCPCVTLSFCLREEFNLQFTGIYHHDEVLLSASFENDL